MSLMFLSHGKGDYMALEEDSWSQQAVGISLNPGDMVLQLVPNVLFLLDGLKRFEGRRLSRSILYFTLAAFASWYEPALSILPTQNSVFQQSSSDK